MMLASYDDILSRIAEEPLWYDEHGVPRYEPFHHDMLSNIYADWAVLLLISCAACGRRFKVALSGSRYFSPMGHPHKRHYGDPPRHGDERGRCAGETMNCNDEKVLEVWQEGLTERFKWDRIPDLEGMIDCEDDA